MNRSLRISLTLLLITLSLVPALAVGAALGWGIFHQERAHVLQLQRQVTNQGAELITSYIKRAEEELYSLIQNPDLRQPNIGARQAALRQALFYHDTFDDLAIVDALGVELAHISRLGVTSEHELHNHRDEAVFNEPMRSQKAYFGDFELSPINGEPLLQMSVPTLDVRTGQPDGVLIARVRMAQILAQITSLPLGTSGTIMVLDHEGQLLAHPNLAAFDGIRSPTPPTDGVAPGVGGQMVLQVRRPLTFGGLDLAIGAELPLAEADAELQRSLSTTGLLLLGVAAIAATLCIISVNRIVRPICALATATQYVSTDDAASHVEVTRQDEIGALQRDFNQMVVDLRAQRAAINERTTALQASLDRQRELIETVAQLSTPLLPVWDGVVLLPIIGHVDAERGTILSNTLLEGVARRRAQVAILDITGLATINDEVIQALLQAAHAIELLGARAMLAGVSAAFASHIVNANLSLGTLESYRDLQSAAVAAVERLTTTQAH